MLFKRILIYRLGSLGDTIVALPIIYAIAHNYPDSERWVLTNNSNSLKTTLMKDIFGNTELIHNYIEYPIGLRKPAKILSLFKQIYSFHPDILIYLTESKGIIRTFRDALFFKFCGIKSIIGLPIKKRLQNSLSFGDGMYEYECHRLYRNIRSLVTINAINQSTFKLKLSKPENLYAKLILNKFGLNIPIIVVSIGAKSNVKDWGDHNWSLLLNKIGHTLKGWGLIMIGSADERQRSSKLLLHWPEKKLNLCGITSIRESAAILNNARVYIGHDSGPMHLASAVGCPCLAIFSSRNLPGEWFPPGKQNKILYTRTSCMGCRKDECNDLNKQCIRSITVDDVYQNFIELLHK